MYYLWVVINLKPIIMIKTQNEHGEGYISPKLIAIRLTCEAGFAVSNENLSEESWGWDE